MRDTRPGWSVADDGARATTRRLHWGCGGLPAPGWINSDLRYLPGVDLCCDIRQGLPLADASIAYVSSMHALQEIPYLELVGVLRELRRVLAPGGVLRLGLPDLDRAIHAYLRGDHDYFYVKDDEVGSLAGKLVVQMTWYGSSRVMFTEEFARELLGRAGFARVARCDFGQTSSRYPEIVTLDNRPRDTLFLEAEK